MEHLFIYFLLCSNYILVEKKKRNKRFLPLLSYFQKLSDNPQASPSFFPRLGSRLCFSSHFFFFFFYPTFKLRRRKKEVLELEERSTYVISSRKLLTGPTKEAECAQTKLRFVHAPYEEKIFIQREVYFRCNMIFACYFHVQITSGKTSILDNKIKLYNLALVEIRFRWKSGYAIFDTLSIILSWSFSYFRVKRKHRGVS